MKRIVYSLLVLTVMMLFVSCDDYETYGEKKEKERDAISAFIKDEGILVISESQFEAQGQTTDTARNEYVYLEKSGVYMQIVRKGALCRYTEFNIADRALQTYNYFISPTTRLPEKMTVRREGSSYTASFASGVMYSTYGASVPAGWLIPLQYIKVGRQDGNEEIAKVKIIVPHTQGQANATSSVYSCFYTITYQREQ